MDHRVVQGLPRLDGRLGVAVRAFYLGALAVTLALLAFGGWLAARDFFSVVPNNLAFGFVTGSGSPAHPNPYQVRIYNPTSEAARRSGLRQDDIILSIQGRPVPANATEHRIGKMMGAIRGDTAVLVTRSSDGAVRTHRLPRQQSAWSAQVGTSGLNGWQRSLLLFGADQLRLLFLAAAAILLYLRRPRDPVALMFGLVCLLMCHRSNSGFWFWLMLGAEGVRGYLGLLQYLVLVVAFSAFPDGRFWPPWSRWLTLAAVPALAAVYALVVVQVLPPAGLNWAIVAFLLASAIGLVQRYRALPPGAERQQIKWAVAGFLAFIILTLLPLLLRAVGLGVSLENGWVAYVASIFISTAASLALPAGLLISLLRYRLYDADAAISRSTAYSLLAVLLVALFTVGKQVAEKLAESVFEGDVGAVSGAATAALVALLISPLHHWLIRWTEHRFQKPLVSLRHGLPELVGDLRETARLESLACAVLERVESGVRATRSALTVGDHVVAARGVGDSEVSAWIAEHPRPEADRIERDREDGLFPVRVPLHGAGTGTIGWLLLGARPDGSLYSWGERAALAEVKDPVARAIQVVRERALRDAETAKAVTDQVAALAIRLEALERRLEALEDRRGLAAE